MTVFHAVGPRRHKRQRALLHLCGLPLRAGFCGLLTVLLLAVAPAQAADWQSVTAGTNTASLNGAGIARQLNEDLYVTLFYASSPSKQAADLLDSRQRRQLQLRVLADRLYPSGVARHFRDLVAINNPRDEIAREAKNLNQFYGLFQHGLMRGDEVVLDNLLDTGLRVRINGSTVATFSSPLMFDLLLRAYLGERPLSAQLRSALLGETDGAGQRATLDRFASLQPADERKLVYQKPVTSVPDTVIADASTPAPLPAATTAPVTTTAPAVTITSKPLVTSSSSGAANKAAAVNSKAAAPVTAAATQASTAAPAQTKPQVIPQVQATNATVTVASTASTPAQSEPPTPTLTEAEIAALLADYELKLREKLQSALEYPTREMRRKHGNTQLARRKDTLQLRLHLDTGGDINAAWLQSRSGEPVLDAAALKLVETQAPFAPLPKALPDSAYEFLVSLQFDPDQ